MANATRQLDQLIRGYGRPTYYNFPGATTALAAAAGAAGVIAGIAVTDGGANTFTVAPGTVIMAAAQASFAGEFWLCSASIGTTTALTAGVVLLSSATAVPVIVANLFPFRFVALAATSNLGPFHPPYPIRVPAGLGIVAQYGSTTGAELAGVGIVVATGL
jgi:hypothetical protein